MKNKETLPMLGCCIHVICLNLHVVLKVGSIHKRQVIQQAQVVQKMDSTQRAKKSRVR